MGFFGKKKNKEEITFEKKEEDTLKVELENEVERLQKEFRAKQEEIKEIIQKVDAVKK